MTTETKPEPRCCVCDCTKSEVEECGDIMRETNVGAICFKCWKDSERTQSQIELGKEL